MKKSNLIKIALARNIECEYDLQCATAELLDGLGYVWFHTPNEGQRHPAVGKKLKKAGLKRGVPDVLIFDLKLAIELKYKKGRMTLNQVRWLNDLKWIGWRAVVCRNMKEVIDNICEE